MGSHRRTKEEDRELFLSFGLLLLDISLLFSKEAKLKDK